MPPVGRLAVVAGHSLLGSGPPPDAVRREVATPWGSVSVLETHGHLLLQRHGLDRYLAPHAIDHRANLAALAALGADRALAIGSVGSLDLGIDVGSFVAPDQFIALQLGISTSDGALGHRVPGLDGEWRAAVIAAWRDAADAELRDGGTYWQAIGPRFETQAEIELIRHHADVIGMTLASEWVVAGELGLRYAAVCAVDNLANGVAERELTLAEYEAGRDETRRRVREALGPALAALAAAA